MLKSAELERAPRPVLLAGWWLISDADALSGGKSSTRLTFVLDVVVVVCVDGPKRPEPLAVVNAGYSSSSTSRDDLGGCGGGGGGGGGGGLGLDSLTTELLTSLGVDVLVAAAAAAAAGVGVGVGVAVALG